MMFPQATLGFQYTQSTDHFLCRVIDDVLQLQLVLVVTVRFRQTAELVRQAETLFHVFRADKVLSRFDATVQVEDLEKKVKKV